MAALGIQDLVDRYYGFDIVPELVAANRARWGSDRVSFQVADLVKDDLPPVDLILCRHLLIHLPLTDCVKVLQRFVQSGSRYLLITDQPGSNQNSEILWTGSYRPVNLSLPPFSLPEPLCKLKDSQSEDDRAVLSLFELSAVARRLSLAAHA